MNFMKLGYFSYIIRDTREESDTCIDHIYCKFSCSKFKSYKLQRSLPSYPTDEF